MAAYFFVLHSGDWQWGENLANNTPLYLQATTACFSAIIIAQIVNVFLCKTPNRSVFSASLFDNYIILWGIALEIVLLGIIDYSPWEIQFSARYRLEPKVWLFIMPFAL